MRTYPKTKVYDLESALTSLGIGEAVVTVLSERGAPTPVAWTRLRAPRSMMGTIGPDAIATAAKASALQSEYGQTVDRESAYEILSAKLTAGEGSRPPQGDGSVPPPPERLHWWQRFGRWLTHFLSTREGKRAVTVVTSVVVGQISRGAMGTGRRRR